jgi:hypothetical protein
MHKRGFITCHKDAVEGVRLKEGDVEKAFEEMEKAGENHFSTEFFRQNRRSRLNRYQRAVETPNPKTGIDVINRGDIVPAI